MNAVISLCHFCELHGPSVLLSTQTFHDTCSPPTGNTGKQPQKTFYGNVKSLTCKVRQVTCEACHSLNPSHTGYISNDHEGRISYLTTEQAMQSDVATLAHQACIRSLSCEVCPGKEGPIFFGDEVRGHVLSRTFFLKDAQARGFQRWFSITVLMRDKMYLLNSWPFLVENIGKFVSELQAKASEVYEREQAERPQRALRLAAAAASEKVSNKHSRSPAELTGDSLVFPRLHLWFTWLLRAGAERLTERMPEALPAELAVHCDHSQETEEGFTLVYTTPSPSLSATSTTTSPGKASLSRVGIVTPGEGSPTRLGVAVPPGGASPSVAGVRHLRRLLGVPTFLSLAYGVLVGRQVVVRGRPASLVGSTLNCLGALLPRRCRRAVHCSEEYLEATRCNLLGVETRVAVPRLSPAVLRLDILSPDEGELPALPDEYLYKLTWGSQLPLKWPTLLYKLEKALDNPSLSDSVMQYHLVALKEEWFNIAKVVRRVEQTGSNVDAGALNSLLQSLGAQEQDKPLLQFWATAAVVG